MRLPLRLVLPLAFLSLLAAAPPAAMTGVGTEPEASAIVGRWDIEVAGSKGSYPSWLEIRKSGYSTLVGSYVGQFGSARPIAEIEPTDSGFRFVVPKQWERRSDDIVYEFELSGDALVGHTTDDQGRRISWQGRRAPTLERSPSPDWQPDWAEPIELFNGRNLEGWTVQLEGVSNGWTVRDGVLVNETPGNNLVSERAFGDFQLRAEFRYPAGSNSGIYLRGRYEVQIQDDHGEPADALRIGGIYGHLTPLFNPARPAGEWQTFDVVLVGRRVTVGLNDETIIDRQVIPGITGGALDSREGEPGPILIQGDHGPVEFRRLTIVPAVPSG